MLNTLYSEDYPARQRLMRVCYTILYSSDSEKIAKAYAVFFTLYKHLVLSNAPAARLSCVEDVIVKTVRGKFQNGTGALGKNEPYVMLLSMAREQCRNKKRQFSEKENKELSRKYPLSDLLSYLVFLSPGSEDSEIKKTYIKNTFHLQWDENQK